MSLSILEIFPRHFVPRTEFGKAVSDSHFGRVCPLCGRRWSSREEFLSETTQDRFDKTPLGTDVSVHRCDCSGEMILDKQGRHTKKRREECPEEKTKSDYCKWI